MLHPRLGCLGKASLLGEATLKVYEMRYEKWKGVWLFGQRECGGLMQEGSSDASRVDISRKGLFCWEGVVRMTRSSGFKL